MKKCISVFEDISISKYFVKTAIVVTTALSSVLLAGCDSVVPDIDTPTPIIATNEHLVELPPKLSTHNLQPMFIVEALGFTAVDETGIDLLGSDEIYAVWHSNAIASTLIQHDVDSGESADFHQLQSCIYPIAGNELIIDGRYGGAGSGWVCKDEGGPRPIRFSVFLYDDDSPWTHLPYCFSGSFVTDCEDTFVGKYNGSWSLEELLEGWPTPGTVKNFTIRLNPCEGPAVCGDDDFPDYDFSFRITRMEDKEILRVSTLE